MGETSNTKYFTITGTSVLGGAIRLEVEVVGSAFRAS